MGLASGIESTSSFRASIVPSSRWTPHRASLGRLMVQGLVPGVHVQVRCIVRACPDDRRKRSERFPQIRGRDGRAEDASCATQMPLQWRLRHHRSTMTLAAGTRLGPYEVVSAIGSGGMGELYRAYDTRLERFVAI